MLPQPNRQMALAQYRLRARFYDTELAAFEPVRRRAIDSLQLKRGETVLDVGCGTGLSFERMRQGVGPRGHIVGIEQSPEMAELARRRVAQHNWHNVTLVNAPVATADIACQSDAALFHFTHDILRQRDGIRHVVRHLKPGARVVAAGLQWSAPWDWLTNGLVLMAAMYSTTSLEGLAQPWSHLAQHLQEVQPVSSSINGVYIICGKVLSKGSEVAHHV